jgi:dTDP-4-dehydrorhamnose reductase
VTRVLVTGAGGMVGRALLESGRALGWEIVGTTRSELDIADPAAVRAAVVAAEPRVVLNAAGYTQVDTAESEPELARRANVDGPTWLADTCAAHGVPLIHISTDYVFDGGARRPYRPDDSPHPLCVYGHTKWEGEQAVRECLDRHLIVRTSWLYAPHGRNFLRTIAGLARERDTLRMVADQHGSPTLAADLARALLRAAAAAAENADVWGTYHFCNAGETTWHGFASAIVDGLASRPGVVCRRVVPITTAEYPTAATRPAYSVLDTTSWTAAFGLAPRPWQEALSDALCRLS